MSNNHLLQNKNQTSLQQKPITQFHLPTKQPCKKHIVKDNNLSNNLNCINCGLISLPKEREFYIKPIFFNFQLECPIITIFEDTKKVNLKIKQSLRKEYLSKRQSMIEYLEYLKNKNNTSLSTYILSVHIMDIIMQNFEDLNQELLVIACFLLSSKFNEKDPFIQSAHDFKSLSKQKYYTNNEVKRYEIVCLMLIEYKLNHITAFNLIESILSCGILTNTEIYLYSTSKSNSNSKSTSPNKLNIDENSFNDKSIVEKYYNKVFYLLETVSKFDIYINYHPLIISCSIISIVKDEFLIKSDWNNWINKTFSITYDNIKDCIIALKQEIFNYEKKKQMNNLYVNTDNKSRNNNSSTHLKGNRSMMDVNLNSISKFSRNNNLNSNLTISEGNYLKNNQGNQEEKVNSKPKMTIDNHDLSRNLMNMNEHNTNIRNMNTIDTYSNYSTNQQPSKSKLESSVYTKPKALRIQTIDNEKIDLNMNVNSKSTVNNQSSYIKINQIINKNGSGVLIKRQAQAEDRNKLLNRVGQMRKERNEEESNVPNSYLVIKNNKKSIDFNSNLNGNMLINEDEDEDEEEENKDYQTYKPSLLNNINNNNNKCISSIKESIENKETYENSYKPGKPTVSNLSSKHINRKHISEFIECDYYNKEEVKRNSLKQEEVIQDNGNVIININNEKEETDKDINIIPNTSMTIDNNNNYLSYTNQTYQIYDNKQDEIIKSKPKVINFSRNFNSQITGYDTELNNDHLEVKGNLMNNQYNTIDTDNSSRNQIKNLKNFKNMTRNSNHRSEISVNIEKNHVLKEEIINKDSQLPNINIYKSIANVKKQSNLSINVNGNINFNINGNNNLSSQSQSISQVNSAYITTSSLNNKVNLSNFMTKISKVSSTTSNSLFVPKKKDNLMKVGYNLYDGNGNMNNIENKKNIIISKPISIPSSKTTSSYIVVNNQLDHIEKEKNTVKKENNIQNLSNTLHKKFISLSNNNKNK